MGLVEDRLEVDSASTVEAQFAVVICALLASKNEPPVGVPVTLTLSLAQDNGVVLREDLDRLGLGVLPG